jgi:hypothetical protein
MGGQSAFGRDAGLGGGRRRKPPERNDDHGYAGGKPAGRATWRSGRCGLEGAAQSRQATSSRSLKARLRTRWIQCPLRVRRRHHRIQSFAAEVRQGARRAFLYPGGDL